MKLFSDLISTDYGIMSLAVIAFTLGMGFWYGSYFKRNTETLLAGDDAAKMQKLLVSRPSICGNAIEKASGDS